MKKKIGISYTETNFRNYWKWFEDQDLMNDVELVELSFVKNNAADIPKCAGFILTGGVDIHPSLYGARMDYDNRPKTFQQRRDDFEEKIYRYSQDNKRPLLGICRGLQLVNVLQGGKLIQDLNSDRNVKHCRIADQDAQHNIRIERNTLLYDIALSSFGSINSAHHQAIDPNAVGSGLIINAYDDCEEELIEGVELENKTNKAFMLCVQWHPERMENKGSVLSNGIKKSFLKAVRSV